jgi:hypothetical protein
MDEGGDGPGLVWNFLVCLAIFMAGKGVPMTGMLAARGDVFAMYMKCVDGEIARAIKTPVATHMVVLTTQAFTQSAMCMVEVFCAIQSGIELVLVNIEEPIDWQAAWPLEKTLASYPFTGGKVKWKAAEFACNRKVVLDKLGGQNSYPRPTIFPGMDANRASGTRVTLPGHCQKRAATASCPGLLNRLADPCLMFR